MMVSKKKKKNQVYNISLSLTGGVRETPPVNAYLFRCAPAEMIILRPNNNRSIIVYRTRKQIRLVFDPIYFDSRVFVFE